MVVQRVEKFSPRDSLRPAFSRKATKGGAFSVRTIFCILPRRPLDISDSSSQAGVDSVEACDMVGGMSALLALSTGITTFFIGDRHGPETSGPAL